MTYSTNKEPLKIISDGKRMYILSEGLCHEIINPSLYEADIVHNRERIPEYSGFEVQKFRLGQESVDIDLRIKGKSMSYKDDFDPLNLEQPEPEKIEPTKKDFIQKYSVFDMFKMINQKVDER